MKLRNIFLFIGIILCHQSYANTGLITLKAPGRSVKLEFFTNGGMLQYRLTSANTVILQPSLLQWKAGDDTFGADVRKVTVLRRYAADDRYETRGAHREARDKHNGLVLQVEETSGETFQVEARAYADGIAFRYLGYSNGRVAVSDLTTFCIPGEAVLWAQNNTKHYEGAYRRYTASDLSLGMKAGPPVTVKYAPGVYAVITEGGLTNFSGMALQVTDKNTFSVMVDGDALQKGTLATPWRVVMVGDLQALVNNDIVSHVSPPLSKQIAGNAQWIKPGKCVWSWLSGYSVSFENMKRFSDWGGELGFEYNLVDEGWTSWKEDGKDCWQLVKELVDYSATKGVKVMLWKAYPDRNGVEGIQTPERRKAFFEKCKKLGVVGLKIDFFDQETQSIVKYYQETLDEAARYGLLINFHGCNKPTGATRTYPNEVTREGIMGLEYGQSWADQNTVTPFTRFLAGHGDYTPLTFQKDMMGETTAAHQIATTAIFLSPLMCYGGSPLDYLSHPAKEMIQAIPTVWDETLVLPPSEIGESIVMARRKGNEWFVAAITMSPQKQLSVPLAFLGKKTYTCSMVADDPADPALVKQQTKRLTARDTLVVDMNKAGGFIARIVPG